MKTPAPPNREFLRMLDMTARDPGEETAWIVSDNPALVDRIKPLLQPLTSQLRIVETQEFDDESFWTPRPTIPDLVILDIGSSIDWGVVAIQRLRLARVRAPIVVITADFSHEFGAKILSEGIRYYFAHDFCSREFHDLAESLLKPASRNVR